MKIENGQKIGIILSFGLMACLSSILVMYVNSVLIEQKTFFDWIINRNERITMGIVINTLLGFGGGGVAAYYFERWKKAAKLNQKAEQKILKLNAELEKRVAERTSELQAEVNELETFAYTVSHDLKSPLRAIDAYIRILLEDYPQQMGGEIGEITGNIQNISKDMIALINKLLQYSTTVRLDIYRENVEISKMVKMIFDELAAAHPERKINIIMAKGIPQVKADKILLKEVLYNLLSNAIKFTKIRDLAVIKVGYAIDKNEVIFSISDNGIGFDMEQAGKLFGIFQRLHSVDEYEGTGIGLATVRKIIQKHGGRTWIEGKPNQGATVYFTLPITAERMPAE